MEFVERARAALSAALRHGRSGSSHGRTVRTALAGLILGFGGVTAGTGLVHASERGGLFDFFGQIFGAPTRPVETRAWPEVSRSPRHYSSLPDARRIAGPRQRQFTPRPVPLVGISTKARGAGRRAGPASTSAAVQRAGGPQSVCVRTCDGYMFPLGALYSQKDVPLHQSACAAACPDAPTALYTLPWGGTELDQIVSLKGQPYLAAAWANVYRRKRVENCHCRTPGVAHAPLSIDHDPTLRVGDVVATRKSAAVVTRLARGDVTVEDYRSTRSLSRSGRHFIDMRIGAFRRDADERAFRRALKAADAGDARTRVAEAKYARIRIGSATGGFETPAPVPTASGFTPVRVMAPSPFEH